MRFVYFCFLKQVEMQQSIKAAQVTVQALLLLDSFIKMTSIGWEPFMFDFWYMVEGVISFLAVSFWFFEVISRNLTIGNRYQQFDSNDRLAVLRANVEATYGDLYHISRTLSIARVFPLIRVIYQVRSIRIVLNSIVNSLAYIANLGIIVLCVW